MCLCGGTGKVTVDRGWGIHFATCPDTACTFDRQSAIEKSEQRMNEILQELVEIECGQEMTSSF